MQITINNRRRLASTFILACSLTATYSGQLQAQPTENITDAHSIMQKVKWRADGSNRRSQLELTLTEKDGFSRSRHVSFYEKDYGKDRKTLLFVEKPADVRSTAILINSFDEVKNSDDDIWLYLPALRKIKRLSSRNKRGKFVGSEFTFADMERLQLADYSYRYLGTEKIEQRPVHKIEARAASDRTTEKTGYSRRLIWVDSERFIILKDQFFDAQGIKLKELSSSKVENISGYWVATAQSIHNQQTGRQTQIKIHDIVYDQHMPDLLFSKQTLRRGPR